MSLRLKSAVSIAALLCSSPVWAGSEPPAGDRVVVSASRTGLEAHKVGSAVSVIEAVDISRNQTRFLKDLLGYAPSVITTSDRPGGQTSVFVRGSENGQVLWLIDGIELGDPTLISSEFQADNLTSFDIERVEILRGNQSSIYGSDAVGGVINIVTKRPTRDGMLGNLQLEGGSYGTFSGGGSVLGRSGPVDFRLTAHGTRNNGPSVADPDNGPASEEDGYSTWGLSGRIGWRLGKNTTLEAIGFGNDSKIDLDAEGQDADPVFSTTVRAETDQQAYAVRLNHDALDDRLKLRATATQFQTDRVYFINDGTTSDYFGRKQNINLFASYDVTEAIAVVGGFDGQWDFAKQDAFGTVIRERVHTLSGFGEVAVVPFENASLTGALRLDNHSTYGNFVTYRLTGAYVFEDVLDMADVKLRSSYGTGEKAPSLYQLYDPTYGNTGLDPEKSRGFDIGADVYAGPGTLSVTYYETRIDDEIGFVWPAGYVQFGETKHRGVEVSLGVDVTEWLSLKQSYALTYVRNVETDTSLGKPRHVGTTHVIVRPLEGLEVTSRTHYRSANKASFGGSADSFVTTDLLANYELVPGIDLFGRLINVFDTDHQLNYGYNAADRSVFAGLRIALEAH